MIKFSGKIYRKKQLWDLAGQEVHSAKNMLNDRHHFVSCLKCKLIMEVRVGQEIGDLLRSYFNNSDDKRPNGLEEAEILFLRSAEKLRSCEWENCVSKPINTTVSDKF